MFAPCRRTLVFSQSVRVLDMLQRCLEATGTSLARIDGASSDVERAAIIAAFNKAGGGGASVCLLTTKVGEPTARDDVAK